jgi:arthrofactin-type cyclic lipopeptide synthetase C
LIGANQEVDFLGLLDTHYFFHTDDVSPKDVLQFDPKNQLFSAVQRKINKDQDEDLQAKLEILRSNSSIMNFEALVEKCREMLLMPKQFSDATSTQIHNWFARMHSHSVAYFYYSPQRLPIPVYLFRAQRDADPYLSWDAVVPNDLLRVIPVSGTHHSMMENPNVEILGKTLSQAIHKATAVSAKQPDHRYSAIIPLQAGRAKEKEPLFCIPGAGSNVSSFVDLTLCLDPQRPIYGLQPRGLEGVFVPHSTVSAASETYIRTVEEIYPKGPIHLLGHSFGGWVALDMAQRFLDAGRHIASLIILDSEIPDQPTKREYNRTDVIMEWLSLLEQIVDHPLDLGRSDVDMRSEVEQIEILHDLLVREGVMSNRLEPDALRGPLHVFGASLRAGYQPQKPYPGPAQLVVVDNPKLDENTNRLEQKRTAEGWKLWVPRIECLHAFGSHITMLKEPHVRSLAQLLHLAANGNAEPVDSPISASSAIPGD